MKKKIATGIVLLMVLALFPMTFAMHENNASHEKVVKEMKLDRLKEARVKHAALKEAFDEKKAERERLLEEYKEKKNELSQERLRWKEFKDNDEDVVTKGKAFLLRHIAAIEKQLEARVEKLSVMNDRIEESDHAADHKEQLLERIEKNLDDARAKSELLNAIKKRVDATQTQEDLRTLATELKTLLVTNHAFNEEINALNTEHLLAKLEQLAATLEKKSTLLAEKGSDVTKAQDLKNRFDARAKEANDHIGAAQVELEKETSNLEEKKAALTSARAHIKEARAAIKDAHKILRDITTQLKELRKEFAQSDDADSKRGSLQ